MHVRAHTHTFTSITCTHGRKEREKREQEGGGRDGGREGEKEGSWTATNGIVSPKDFLLWTQHVTLGGVNVCGCLDKALENYPGMR